MKKVIVRLVCVISLMVSTLVMAEPETVNIILAGDSTVAAYSSKSRPLAGWGEFLPFCFDDNVKVINHATGGASTRTFRTWRRWDRVIRSAKKGDYIFIQFGHNNEKAHRVKKYTDPDTTYQENLKRYIKEAQAVGATPVLVTPPVRLIYGDNGMLKESHVQDLWHAPEGTRKTSTTYTDAMRQVAKETGVALLDLNKVSKEKIEAMSSKEEAEQYYLFVKPGDKNYPDGKKDVTHFSLKGAALMAECIAEELRRINSPLTAKLKPENQITVNRMVSEFTDK